MQFQQTVQSKAGRFRISRSAVALATLLALLVHAVGCASPSPPPTAPIPPTYRIGPPDRLFISVLPAPTIERKVVVRPDGMISFDLIGDVRASGRTTTEIGDEIESRIARFKRDARALVVVELSQTSQVTVFGEVSRPGLMPLTTETRVAEVLGSRGGTTFLAWKSRIRLIRTDGKLTTVHRINLAAIERGDLGSNMLMRGGDIVVVPRTPLGVVGGLIQQIVFPFSTIMGPAMGATSLATRLAP